MIKAGISRTSRILTVYHLFSYCREVSIYEVVPAVCVKTFFRDVKLLQNAGVLKTKFSKKDNAYIPLELELFEPNLPEGKPQRDYIMKIRRLCILMNELYCFEDEEKPLHIELYERLFPDVNVRTRQRDFAELALLGFYADRYIGYVFDDKEFESMEKRFYRFIMPMDSYDLKTIEKEEW